MLVNDAAWADPNNFLKPTPITTTLAAESRLRPFFERHGLDFRNIATVVYAAGELNKRIQSDDLRDSHIVRLNRLFPADEIEIKTPVQQASLSSGRSYNYASFHFNKADKTIDALFFKDHEKLTEAELDELGIRTVQDRTYFNSPGLAGLKGVWFVDSVALMRAKRSGSSAIGYFDAHMGYDDAFGRILNVVHGFGSDGKPSAASNIRRSVLQDVYPKVQLAMRSYLRRNCPYLDASSAEVIVIPVGSAATGLAVDISDLDMYVVIDDSRLNGEIGSRNEHYILRLLKSVIYRVFDLINYKVSLHTKYAQNRAIGVKEIVSNLGLVDKDRRWVRPVANLFLPSIGPVEAVRENILKAILKLDSPEKQWDAVRREWRRYVNGKHVDRLSPEVAERGALNVELPDFSTMLRIYKIPSASIAVSRSTGEIGTIASPDMSAEARSGDNPVEFAPRPLPAPGKPEAPNVSVRESAFEAKRAAIIKSILDDPAIDPEIKRFFARPEVLLTLAGSKGACSMGMQEYPRLLSRISRLFPDIERIINERFAGAVSFVWTIDSPPRHELDNADAPVMGSMILADNRRVRDILGKNQELFPSLDKRALLSDESLKDFLADFLAGKSSIVPYGVILGYPKQDVLDLMRYVRLLQEAGFKVPMWVRPSSPDVSKRLRDFFKDGRSEDLKFVFRYYDNAIIPMRWEASFYDKAARVGFGWSSLDKRSYDRHLYRHARVLSRIEQAIGIESLHVKSAGIGDPFAKPEAPNVDVAEEPDDAPASGEKLNVPGVPTHILSEIEDFMRGRLQALDLGRIVRIVRTEIEKPILARALIEAGGRRIEAIAETLRVSSSYVMGRLRYYRLDFDELSARPDKPQPIPEGGIDIKDAARRAILKVEKALVIAALARAKGDIGEAAKLLMTGEKHFAYVRDRVRAEAVKADDAQSVKALAPSEYRQVPYPLDYLKYLETLERTNNDVNEAARQLGVGKSNVYDKFNKTMDAALERQDKETVTRLNRIRHKYPPHTEELIAAMERAGGDAAKAEDSVSAITTDVRTKLRGILRVAKLRDDQTRYKQILAWLLPGYTERLISALERQGGNKLKASSEMNVAAPRIYRMINTVFRSSEMLGDKDTADRLSRALRPVLGKPEAPNMSIFEGEDTPKIDERAAEKLFEALTRTYRAIVLDADGTLTDLHQREVPDEAIDMIVGLIERKVYVVISTGRIGVASAEEKAAGYPDIEEIFRKIRPKVKDPDSLRYLLGFEQAGVAGFNGFPIGDSRRVEYNTGLKAQNKAFQEKVWRELYAKYPTELEKPEFKSHGMAAHIKKEFATPEFKALLLAEAKRMVAAAGYDYVCMNAEKTLNIAVKGAQKSNAIKVLVEKFGLKEDEIASAGDAGEPEGNDYCLAERKGGFCVGDYFDPDSVQVSMGKAVGLKFVYATMWLMDRLKFAANEYPIKPESPNVSASGGLLFEEEIEKRLRMISGKALTVKALDEAMNSDLTALFAALLDFKAGISAESMRIEDAQKGMCKNASAVFCNVFERLFPGHEVQFVLGAYLPLLESYNAEDSEHWWVEIDGRIAVDITYGQFDSDFTGRVLVTDVSRLSHFGLRVDEEEGLIEKAGSSLARSFAWLCIDLLSRVISAYMKCADLAKKLSHLDLGFFGKMGDFIRQIVYDFAIQIGRDEELEANIARQKEALREIEAIKQRLAKEWGVPAMRPGADGVSKPSYAGDGERPEATKGLPFEAPSRTALNAKKGKPEAPNVAADREIVNVTGVEPHIKVVVLDWDGTVANTMRAVMHAWRIIYAEIMQGNEKETVDSFIATHGGKSLYDLVDILFDKAGASGVTDLKEKKYYCDRFCELLVSEVKRMSMSGEEILIPETIAFLKDLRQRNFTGKIIQTSGVPNVGLRPVITYFGLEHLYDEIYGAYPPGSKEPRNKAELIIDLKRRYGLADDEIVMIGDMRGDIEEGKKGGAVTVGIAPNIKMEETLVGSGADMIIRSNGINSKIIDHLGMEFAPRPPPAPAENGPGPLRAKDGAVNAVSYSAHRDDDKFLARFKPIPQMDDEMRHQYLSRLAAESAQRKREWVRDNQREIMRRPDESMMDWVFRVVYIMNHEVPRENIRIIRKTETEIIVSFDNVCPVLNACSLLGLDTRQVCKGYMVKSEQALLSILDPRLRVERDFIHIRPHTDCCTERITLGLGDRDPEDLQRDLSAKPEAPNAAVAIDSNPVRSSWGLQEINEALKNLTPMNWYARTAVIPIGENRVLAIKFLKKKEDPSVLEEEAKTMQNMVDAGIGVMIPQRPAGSGYVFNCATAPANATYDVDASYRCIAYIARPELFIYPEDIRDAGTMRRCAMNSIIQFARMLKAGFVHTSLAPLSHNNGLVKPWVWNHDHLGGVDDMDEASGKSNIRLGGLADFAHVRKAGQIGSAYDETIQAICEWTLVIAYHSLKNGITENDVVLTLRDGLEEFLNITGHEGGPGRVELDRLREFVRLFHKEFDNKDTPFRNTPEAPVFDNLVSFVTSTILRHENDLRSAGKPAKPESPNVDWSEPRGNRPEEATWTPAQKGDYVKIGKFAKVHLKTYLEYFRNLGLDISGITLRIESGRLNAYPIYSGGGASQPAILHSLELGPDGLPARTRGEKKYANEITLLKAIEEQGEPIALFADTELQVYLKKVRYSFKEYFQRKNIPADDVWITKQLCEDGKIRLQVRKKAKGIEMNGDVIDALEIDEDSVPISMRSHDKKLSISYLEALQAPGEDSIDRDLGIKYGYAHTYELTIGGFTYTGIGTYFNYVKDMFRSAGMGGTGELKAIKLFRDGSKLRISAVIRSLDGNFITGEIESLDLDVSHRPLAVEKDAGANGISIMVALRLQGRAEELFISKSDAYGEHFSFNGVLCDMDSYLDRKGLKAADVRVIRFMGIDKSPRIEIRKRDKLAFGQEEVLDILDADSEGWPLKLAKNADRCSLLQLLIDQGKLAKGENRLTRDHTALYRWDVRYVGIKEYFDFLDSLNLGKIDFVKASATDTEIVFEAMSGDKAVVTHTLKLGPDKVPTCAIKDSQRIFVILLILTQQGAIDKKVYDEFRKTYEAKSLGKPKSFSGKGLLYPTRESAVQELAARKAKYGDEQCNTSVSLQQRKADGGNWPLWHASRRFKIDFPVAKRDKKYPTEASVRQALGERSAKYGNDQCNTAYALNKSKEDGGDFSLLYASRNFGVGLPRAQRQSSAGSESPSAFEAYLGGLSKASLPSEDDAAAKWFKGFWGRLDDDAARSLVDELRGLVADVIRTEMGIELDPESRTEELIKELVAQGNYILVSRIEGWDFNTGLLIYLRQILVEGLRKARTEFFSMSNRRWVALDDNERVEGKNELRKESRVNRLPSTVSSPAENAALLIDGDIRTDLPDAGSTSTGLILAEDKRMFADRLRGLFADSKLLSVFENHEGHNWALFTTHSLGWQGTAVRGNCDWNAIIVTDLPSQEVPARLESLAAQLGGKVQHNPGRLPTVVIGKDGDYHNVLRLARQDDGNGNFLGRLVSVLSQFGIGSAKRGFATIDVISVEDKAQLAASTTSFTGNPFVYRAVVQTAEDETASFSTGINGIVIAESGEGASRALLGKLIDLTADEMREDFRMQRDAIEETFFQRQAQKLSLAAKERPALSKPEAPNVASSSASHQTFGLVTTDPREYRRDKFSFLSHAGIGERQNSAHLDRLFENLDNARNLVFCTLWNTQSHPAAWDNSALLVDISKEGEVLWEGSTTGRRFFPYRLNDAELEEAKDGMRRGREAMDLSVYKEPEDFFMPLEVDVTGADIVGIYLKFDTPDVVALAYSQARFEFMALALKYNLPIVLDMANPKNNPFGLFEKSLSDDSLVRILKARGLYAEDYKEKIRALLVKPASAEGSRPEGRDLKPEAPSAAAGKDEDEELFRPKQIDYKTVYRRDEKDWKRHPGFGWATVSELRNATYRPVSDIPQWDLISKVLLEIDGDFNMRNQGYGMCWEWAYEMWNRITELMGKGEAPGIEEIKFMRTIDDLHSWIALKMAGRWYVVDRTIGQYKAYENYPGGLYTSLEQAKKASPFYGELYSVEIALAPEYHDRWREAHISGRRNKLMQEEVAYCDSCIQDLHDTLAARDAARRSAGSPFEAPGRDVLNAENGKPEAPNAASSDADSAVDITEAFEISAYNAVSPEALNRTVDSTVHIRNPLAQLLNDEARDVLYEMGGNIYRHSADRAGTLEVQTVKRVDGEGIRFVSRNKVDRFGLGSFFVTFDDVRDAYNGAGSWHVGFEKMISFADEFSLVHDGDDLVISVTKWQKPPAQKRVSIKLANPDENEAIRKITSVPDYNYDKLELICRDAGPVGAIARRIMRMTYGKVIGDDTAQASPAKPEAPNATAESGPGDQGSKAEREYDEIKVYGRSVKVRKGLLPNIRDARPEDAEAIAALSVRMDETKPVDFRGTLSVSKYDILGFIDSPELFVIKVYVIGNSVAGFALGYIEEKNADCLNLVVAKEHEGEGIGTALAVSRLLEFEKRGVKRVETPTAHPNSAAIARKLGFRRADTIVDNVYVLNAKPEAPNVSTGKVRLAGDDSIQVKLHDATAVARSSALDPKIKSGGVSERDRPAVRSGADLKTKQKPSSAIKPEAPNVDVQDKPYSAVADFGKEEIRLQFTSNGQYVSRYGRDSSQRRSRMLDWAIIIHGKIRDEMYRKGFDSAAESVSHILGHMIPNAVDAIFERIDSGEINEKSGIIEFTLSVDQKTKALRLTLADNGVGIEDDVIEAWRRGEYPKSTKGPGTDKYGFFIGQEGTGMMISFETAWTSDIGIVIKTSRKGSGGYKIIPTQEGLAEVEGFNKNTVGTEIDIVLEKTSPEGNRDSAHLSGKPEAPNVAAKASPPSPNPSFKTTVDPLSLFPIKELSDKFGMDARDFAVDTDQLTSDEISMTLSYRGKRIAHLEIAATNKLDIHIIGATDYARYLPPVLKSGFEDYIHGPGEDRGTFRFLKWRADISIDIASHLRDRGISSAWYRDYLEKYISGCGFDIVAVQWRTHNARVRKFWERLGFNDKFTVVNAPIYSEPFEKFILIKTLETAKPSYAGTRERPEATEGKPEAPNAAVGDASSALPVASAEERQRALDIYAKQWSSSIFVTIGADSFGFEDARSFIENGLVVVGIGPDGKEILQFVDWKRRELCARHWFRGVDLALIEKHVLDLDAWVRPGTSQIVTSRDWGEGFARNHGHEGFLLEFDFAQEGPYAAENYISNPYSRLATITQAPPLTLLTRRCKDELIRRLQERLSIHAGDAVYSAKMLQGIANRIDREIGSTSSDSPDTAGSYLVSGTAKPEAPNVAAKDDTRDGSKANSGTVPSSNLKTSLPPALIDISFGVKEHYFKVSRVYGKHGVYIRPKGRSNNIDQLSAMINTTIITALRDKASNVDGLDLTYFYRYELSDLIDNAIDAIFKRIDAGRLSEDEPAPINFRFYVDARSGNFHLVLSDVGVGINEGILRSWRRNKFYSTKRQEKRAFIGRGGMGIKYILQDMKKQGFEISVESKCEEGRALSFTQTKDGKRRIAPCDKKGIGTIITITGPLLKDIAKIGMATKGQERDKGIAMDKPEAPNVTAGADTWYWSELDFGMAPDPGMEALLEALEDVNAVVLAGPSGAGKSTFLRNVPDEYLYKPLLTTTRAPRDGEFDGVDYHFISEEEFLRLEAEGRMLFTRHASGCYYGTDETEALKMIQASYEGKVVILETNKVDAVEKMKKVLPKLKVLVVLNAPREYYTDPAKVPLVVSDLKERLRSRVKGMSEAELETRARESVENTPGLLAVADLVAANRRDADNADSQKAFSVYITNMALKQEADRIHAENLSYVPDEMSVNTVICHIIADPILPAGQVKEGVLNRLEVKMRDKKYSEKVVELSVSDPDNAEEFMAKLLEIKRREEDRYKGSKVIFDVACHDIKLVARIQALKMQALAFSREGDGNMVQVEGIMLALRALQSENIDNLLDVYKLLSGKPASIATRDITELAQRLAFILPARKIDIDKVGTINRLIEENIKNAA